MGDGYTSNRYPSRDLHNLLKKNYRPDLGGNLMKSKRGLVYGNLHNSVSVTCIHLKNIDTGIQTLPLN